MFKKQIILHIIFTLCCVILVWVITDNFLRYKHKSLEDYSNNFYQEYLEKWLSSKQDINNYNFLTKQKVPWKRGLVELGDVLNYKKENYINNLEWYGYTQIEEFNLLSDEDKIFLIQKDKIKNIYQLYNYSNKMIWLIMKDKKDNYVFESNKQLFSLAEGYYSIYSECSFESECFNDKVLLNEYIKENELKINKMNNILSQVLKSLKNKSILKDENDN